MNYVKKVHVNLKKKKEEARGSNTFVYDLNTLLEKGGRVNMIRHTPQWTTCLKQGRR